jgi:hypothetical protein
MISIKNLTIGQISLDFQDDIYNRLINKYGEIKEFVERLEFFLNQVTIHRDQYNINPYSDKINRGIYILGLDDSELGIFPDSSLALKCSQKTLGAENLRKQFYRSIQLTQELEVKLDPDQKALLQICPVYFYVKINVPNSFFKEILFMKRIKEDKTFAYSEWGFGTQFRQAFKIPSLEQIKHLSRFALHQYLDRDQQRQLLKIQTVYLFERLWCKGIRILSLNQKNILVSQDVNSNQNRYFIIDPSPDYYLPISPIYNSLTFPLIRWGNNMEKD